MPHVDSECLAWPLIDTIAVVVELSERGTEVIRIVAEGVRGQVVKDMTYDLQEANQSLGKLSSFSCYRTRVEDWAAILIWLVVMSCALCGSKTNETKGAG